MPNFGENYAQRKGAKNVPSPSVNRTGRAAEKAQETKQRSQSIIHQLNSDNKKNSEPLEEDAEVEEDAEDHIGSPTDLSNVFGMATPTTPDQKEGGERSATPGSDARALQLDATIKKPHH